ncbi:MAG: hypothetical protein ACC656_03540, partial [Candidatus Heimdallarchaeota archaeon]
ITHNRPEPTIRNHRLEELRNFRKTFEERKSIWNSKIEQKQDSHSAHSNKSQPRVFRSTSSAINRSRLKTRTTGSKIKDSTITRGTQVPVAKNENMRSGNRPKADKGLLSNYRSMLVRTQNPVRAATIRQDRKDESNLDINYRQTPEVIYRTLMKKKRLREVRK